MALMKQNLCSSERLDNSWFANPLSVYYAQTVQYMNLHMTLLRLLKQRMQYQVNWLPLYLINTHLLYRSLIEASYGKHHHSKSTELLLTSASNCIPDFSIQDHPPHIHPTCIKLSLNSQKCPYQQLNYPHHLPYMTLPPQLSCIITLHNQHCYRYHPLFFTYCIISFNYIFSITCYIYYC